MGIFVQLSSIISLSFLYNTERHFGKEPLGGIHKLRHTLRGRKGQTKCDIVWHGGGILNLVTSHFCCFSLIISRCKIAKYVTSHLVGFSEMWPSVTRMGWVKKSWKSCVCVLTLTFCIFCIWARFTANRNEIVAHLIFFIISADRNSRMLCAIKRKCQGYM